MKRKIIVFFCVFMLCGIHVRANEDPYYEIYEQSGVAELENALPDEAREQLSEYGIDPSDSEWESALSAQNVFSHIWQFVKSAGAAPLRAGIMMIGIILISAALPALSSNGKGFDAARQATALAVAVTVALPIWNTVSAATNAVRGCGAFMLSFIPVFAVTVTASGHAVTAASMSALLLGAAQAVSAVSSFSVLPMMGGYLAVSLCSGVSPLSIGGLAESIKKTAFWILSFISTLFVGILGIQTAVNSAADSLTLRTTRFIIGTAIPVAGAALSEAAGTLSASMGLLRSSVGIYGVVALAAILLPILIELILWRMLLMLSSAVSELFGQGVATRILKACDMMLSVLIGLLLLVGAMFIISHAIVIGASGK